MLIIVEKTGTDVATIHVQGPILFGDGDYELKNEVGRLLDSDNLNLVLDLADVPYIDHGGLGALVSCYNKVKNAGGTLELQNATTATNVSLKLAKLLSVFENHEAILVTSFV